MCMMIYVLFWIFGFVYSDKCYNSSSNGVTESWFCCNNHEDRNGICIECVVGYVSKDGFPCMPCLYGRYGKKCGNICSCQHDERCNIVYGCIEGTIVMTGSVQDGKCYNKSSNGVNKSWFCCNNHEEENGKCKECKIGYVSKDGWPCMPCSPGRWGKKCVDVCSCQHNERCDIVQGCLEETTMMSENWDGTKPTKTTSNTTAANNVLTTETNDVLLLIIYAMGAGSIAVIIALASFCFKYKRKAERFPNSRSMRFYNDKAATEGESVSRNNESVHDSTDENTTIDNHMLIRIVSSNEHVNHAGRRYSGTVDQDYKSGSFSFSDERVTEIADGGFVNSYLSMTEVDKHRKLPENTMHQSEKISSENSESTMNSTVQIYGNIQPYTSIPTIPYCDVTEYTPIDKAVSKPMDTD